MSGEKHMHDWSDDEIEEPPKKCIKLTSEAMMNEDSKDESSGSQDFETNLAKRGYALSKIVGYGNWGVVAKMKASSTAYNTWNNYKSSKNDKNKDKNKDDTKQDNDKDNSSDIIFVAIKQIPKHKFDDREIKLIQDILQAKNKFMQGYDNIVHTWDDFTIGKYHYIVMQNCECSLRRLIFNEMNQFLSFKQRKKAMQNVILSPKHVGYLAYHLLQGLNWLHINGLYHRDLKMDNVLLTESGNVKICDFGSLKKIDDLTNDEFQTECYSLSPESMCFVIV